MLNTSPSNPTGPAGLSQPLHNWYSLNASCVTSAFLLLLSLLLQTDDLTIAQAACLFSSSPYSLTSFGDPLFVMVSALLPDAPRSNSGSGPQLLPGLCSCSLAVSTDQGPLHLRGSSSFLFLGLAHSSLARSDRLPRRLHCSQYVPLCFQEGS